MSRVGWCGDEDRRVVVRSRSGLRLWLRLVKVQLQVEYWGGEIGPGVLHAESVRFLALILIIKDCVAGDRLPEFCATAVDKGLNGEGWKGFAGRSRNLVLPVAWFWVWEYFDDGRGQHFLCYCGFTGADIGVDLLENKFIWCVIVMEISKKP